MKNIPNRLTAPVLTLLLAFGLAACDKDRPDGPNKNNPAEHPLASCAFGLEVRECEFRLSDDSRRAIIDLNVKGIVALINSK